MVNDTSYTLGLRPANVAEAVSVVPLTLSVALWETVPPGPIGVSVIVTGEARAMLPRLPSATSVMSAASATVAVPPGELTCALAALPGDGTTFAFSRETVSVLPPLLLRKNALLLVNAAVIACAPAPPVIVYASVALPLPLTGADPTGVPSTLNCTEPLMVWFTTVAGVTFAVSVTLSLYCPAAAPAVVAVAAGALAGRIWSRAPSPL